MGCRSDYMEANEREKESVRVAKLICFLFPKIDKEVPADVKTAAAEYYGTVGLLDAHTALLCETLNNLPKSKMDAIVYNGRDPKARKLADWWDAHQKADRERKAKEKADAKTAATKKKALEKLTKAEREALGL